MAEVPYLTEEQIEMISKVASPETAHAVDTSSAPFSDEKITCTMCYVPYHTPNMDDGSIEVPYITVCGHIFGRQCLVRWQTECHENSLLHGSFNCPTCRFKLQFLDCTHDITPLPAWQPTTPKCLKADEILDMCLRCEYTNVAWEYRDPDAHDNTGTLIGKLEASKRPIERKIGSLIGHPQFNEMFEHPHDERHDRDVDYSGGEIGVRVDISRDMLNNVADLRDQIRKIDKKIEDLEQELKQKMEEKDKELIEAYENQSSWKIPFFKDVPFKDGVPFLGRVGGPEPEESTGDNETEDNEMEVESLEEAPDSE